MKYECDLIRDLLPLYTDNACSPSSAKAVEQHLSECQPCSDIFKSMKSCDTDLDKEIIKERDEVLVKQAKFFKRRSTLAGSIVGAVFSLPILICLIVNLATGTGLTWFFIVLTAMFIPASLTVVPLMMPENKALWTLGTFTASLLTLLGVCCLYSGGSWFFIAGSAVLFGLSVPFMPFVVNAKPIAKRLGAHRALTVVTEYTLSYILMMICIGIKVGSESYFRTAAAFSAPPLAYMWLMLALIRLPKWNGTIKAASCVFLSAVFYFLSDTFVILALGRGLRLPKFDFTSMNAGLIDDSISWTVLILGTVISIVLAAVGIHKEKRNNRRNEK